MGGKVVALGRPIVTVMQSAQAIMGKHPPRGYAASSAPRRSLSESKMGAVLVMVGDVLGKQALQMPLVESNHMVEQLATAASHPALGNTILPGTFEGGPHRVYLQGSNGCRDLCPVLRIPVMDQKSRSRPKRKCLPQLLDDPTAGRMPRDVEVQDTAAIMADDRFLSLDEMKCIIEAAREPYKTYYWILAETGVRAGEIGALPVSNLLLDHGAIRITQNAWHGKIQTVKSVKGNRVCEISPQLVEHLRGYLRSWKPNSAGLLFATKNGTPWDTDLIRKRKLYPLLDQLNIERCGFHAFRHGNETVMDQENVPMAVRQGRLGHSDPRTTMMYSHAVSEDGRRFAAKLGDVLVPSKVVMPVGVA
jgi:hypothetical protein